METNLTVIGLFVYGGYMVGIGGIMGRICAVGEKIGKCRRQALDIVIGTASLRPNCPWFADPACRLRAAGRTK